MLGLSSESLPGRDTAAAGEEGNGDRADALGGPRLGQRPPPQDLAGVVNGRGGRVEGGSAQGTGDAQRLAANSNAI